MHQSPRANIHMLLSLICVFLVHPFQGKAQHLMQDNVELMIERVQKIEAEHPPAPANVRKLMELMNPDGSWNNIDYNGIGFSPWEPLKHLTNHVLHLAKAFANSSSPFYHDKKIAQGLHKSLGFWLSHNFTSRNWWENVIGVPKTLGTILILMGQEATQKEILQAFNQMRGSTIGQTGQNRVWRAEIQLKIALLEFGIGRDSLLGSASSRMKKATDVLKDEVKLRSKEGIQVDWSYHQHGVQQQFGNYGLAFASTQAEWAYVLKGTPYAYASERLTILKNYILRGLSRVVWNGMMDISAIGRQIFPDSPTNKAQNVQAVLKLMSKVYSDTPSVFAQAIGADFNHTAQPAFLKGNIYFWRSDLMVDRTPDCYISVRMCSQKIQSTESGNGENMLGAHLSDGATYIYQSGTECKNIFPVWDWHRIPGVTSYQDEKLPRLGWGGLHNGSNFVGGVSDTANGASAMIFKRDGLTAHKAWFFMPKGVVCLGAGITSRKQHYVLTTLNQRLHKGKVKVKENDERANGLPENKTIDSDNLEWVLHEGIGYFFLQKENVHVDVTNQQGSWQRIHMTGSPQTISRDVFNLWIDHGKHPQKDSYAYMIRPAVNQEKLNSFGQNKPIKILQNNENIQAVKATKANLTEIIFYQPGKIITPSLNLKVDTPCLLMLRQKYKAINITISAPPELKKQVKLVFKGHLSGKNCSYNAQKDETRMTVKLSGHTYAGESINRDLNVLN